MSKNYTVNSEEIEKLEKAHRSLRESMTPAQRRLAEKVDAAFEAEKEDFDQRIDAENDLRRRMSYLCGFNLDMNEIERFKKEVQLVKNGTLFRFCASRGNVTLFKTVFGTVETVESYLKLLEKTIIDVTNNSQFTPLKSFDLIKLAFNRLLKRSK